MQNINNIIIFIPYFKNVFSSKLSTVVKYTGSVIKDFEGFLQILRVLRGSKYKLM